MKVKQGFLLTSFITGRTISCKIFINRNLNFLHIPLTLKKIMTLHYQVNLQKDIFLYKKFYATIFSFIHNFISQKFTQSTSFSFTTFSLRKVKPC